MKSRSLLRTKLRSFSLIEVVVAIGILVLFLGSLISLFSIGSRNILVAAHRLQAANLARGGVEIARQIRDTAWMQTTPLTWAQMNADCWLPEGTGYPVSNCNGTGRLGIKLGNEPAPGPVENNVAFTRRITIVTIGDIKKVTVTVSWNDAQNPAPVQAVTYLTNWQ